MLKLFWLLFHCSDMVSSQLRLHRYQTGRDSRVVTALTLLKKHLFRYFCFTMLRKLLSLLIGIHNLTSQVSFSYQGHVSAALVLGGVDITGPHLHTVSFKFLIKILSCRKLFSGSFILYSISNVLVKMQIYPHGSTDTLPFATMGSGSLASMSVFEAKYKEGLTVSKAETFIFMF